VPPLVGSEIILGEGIFKRNYAEFSTGVDTRDLLELTGMRVLASCPKRGDTCHYDLVGKRNFHRGLLIAATDSRISIES
jgi:hypothetical protein